MEITMAQFAKIVGVQRQTIYSETNKNRLTRNESKKYNIYDPKNSEYMKKHKKSIIDVQNFMQGQNIVPEKKEPVIKNKDESENESLLLIKCVSKVITNYYGIDAAKKIKNDIFMEFKKIV